MTEEKLLTIREVSTILGISEKEVIELAEDGRIPAYKVAGVYLRFRREQIYEFRKTLRNSPIRKSSPEQRYRLSERLSDFFYFNDFYILIALIIGLIIFAIFKGY